jgi:hypothetical protein
MKAANSKHFITSLLVLTAIVLCGPFTAKAQTTTTTAKTATTATKPATTSASKGVSSLLDAFFKKYKTSPDSAIDYIFGTNKLFGNNPQINLLKQKIDSLQLSLGKYIGHELISQRSATNSLVIYSYLVKHEDQPIRFIFMFYKPKNDWELYRFNYDDGMDTELLEAVKINNKKVQP